MPTNKIKPLEKKKKKKKPNITALRRKADRLYQELVVKCIKQVIQVKNILVFITIHPRVGQVL